MVTVANRGRGGVKFAKILLTSYVNAPLQIKAFDRKDKIPSYLTTNILKLSAAIHLNFETKSLLTLTYLFELQTLNAHRSMVLGWGVFRSSSSCPTSDAPHHHLYTSWIG